MNPQVHPKKKKKTDISLPVPAGLAAPPLLPPHRRPPRRLAAAAPASPPSRPTSRRPSPLPTYALHTPIPAIPQEEASIWFLIRSDPPCGAGLELMEKGKSVVAELAASLRDVEVTPRRKPASSLPAASFCKSPGFFFLFIRQDQMKLLESEAVLDFIFTLLLLV